MRVEIAEQSYLADLADIVKAEWLIVLSARRVYLEGAGLPMLTHDLWPLALIAAVTLSGASWMFGNRIT